MKKKPTAWTLAKLAALLGRLNRRPTLDELKSKYGISVLTLARLNRRVLGTVGETESNSNTSLAIQIGEGVAFSTVGPILEKSVSISKAELKLVRLGLRWLVAGPETKRALDALVRRLPETPGASPLDIDEVLSDPLMTPKEGEGLYAFMEGRRDNRKVRFHYEGSRPSNRTVYPLSLRKDAGEWRFLVWDEDKKALRVFKLIHVSEAKVLADTFEWPASVDREKALAQDLSIYRPNGEEVEVKLKIKADSLRRLRRLFPLCKIPSSGNPWVKVHLLSTSPEWVARELMTALGEVEVLSPPEFKKAFQDERQAILAKYR